MWFSFFISCVTVFFPLPLFFVIFVLCSVSYMPCVPVLEYALFVLWYVWSIDSLSDYMPVFFICLYVRLLARVVVAAAAL